MCQSHTSILVLLCSAALLVSVPLRAKAQLGGTNVTGGIYFDGNISFNGYDPAKGDVPAGSGYENTAGTTVAISDSAVEFGFYDGYNNDTADFSDLTLTVSDSIGAFSALPWEQTFTDPDFNGVFTKISDTFDNGGVTASISGDTITLNWAGTNAADVRDTAVFNVGSVLQVPEPSTWTLVAAGGVLAALVAWRKRFMRL